MATSLNKEITRVNIDNPELKRVQERENYRRTSAIVDHNTETIEVLYVTELSRKNRQKKTIKQLYLVVYVSDSIQLIPFRAVESSWLIGGKEVREMTKEEIVNIDSGTYVGSFTEPISFYESYVKNNSEEEFLDYLEKNKDKDWVDPARINQEGYVEDRSHWWNKTKTQSGNITMEGAMAPERIQELEKLALEAASRL